MSRKPSLLVSALKNNESELSALPPIKPRNPSKDVAVSVPPQQQPKPQSGTYVPPSRINKTAKTHHLPPVYWQTLEEISFRTRDEKGRRIPQERLLAEALNLLFVKYNYPQVRDELGKHDYM